MKKLIELITTLIFLVAAADLAMAGESATLSISCTIPAIPGINAPPFEKKELLKEESGTENTPQEPAKNQAQDKKETLFIVQELPGNIQVVYSR